MYTLRNVLLINGVSSGATGILLVAFKHFISDLFQLNHPTAFLSVGIFLVAFAVLVIVAALKNYDRSKVLFIITLDVLWVLGSILLLIFNFGQISMVGNILVIAVTVWVAGVAFLQAKNLKN